MRRLLERGVYFSLTVTTSTKQIRRVVCSRSKIGNRVCEQKTNLICANAKPRDVVNSSFNTSMFSPTQYRYRASQAADLKALCCK